MRKAVIVLKKNKFIHKYESEQSQAKFLGTLKNFEIEACC